MLESFSNFSKNDIMSKTGTSNIITGSTEVGSEYILLQNLGEVNENTILTLSSKEEATDPFFFQVGEGLAEIDRLNRINTPGASFRSMNDPTVYGTIEDDLMKYSDSELMESDTTTRDGILSQINPLNFLGFLTKVPTPNTSCTHCKTDLSVMVISILIRCELDILYPLPLCFFFFSARLAK